jgi:hypothetical protein
MVRVHFGGGWAMPNDTYRALRKDGFSAGLRWHAMTDISLSVHRFAGIGLWGGYAGNSWEGAFDGGSDPGLGQAPVLTQRVAYVGIQSPIYLARRPLISLTPRLGGAYGTLSFYGKDDWQSAWTFGFEFSVVDRLMRGRGPSPYLGVSLGALWAPLDSPKNYPVHRDMGGLFVSLVGGFGE